MALAASAVLAIIAVAVSFVLPERGESSSGVTARLALPKFSAPRTVRLGSVRGMGTTPDVLVARNDPPRELTIQPDVVVLTCADGSIELECAGGIEPQTPQYAEYEMDLVNRRDSTVAWHSMRQLPASGTQLSFVVPNPAGFASGDYDMIVRGFSPDHEEVVGRFWLKITPQ
jgi:hypothetical protein